MVPTKFITIICVFCLFGGGAFSVERPAVCRLPPPVDDCGGEQQNRWHFSEEHQACVPFVFRGCQTGSANSFATTEECQKVCFNDPETERDSDSKDQTTAESVRTSFSVDRSLIGPGQGLRITAKIPEATEGNGQLQAGASQQQQQQQQQSTQSISDDLKIIESVKSSLFAQTTESSPSGSILGDRSGDFETGNLDERGDDGFPPGTPKVQEDLRSIDDAELRFRSGQQPLGGGENPAAKESNSGFLELQNSGRREDGERTMAQAEMGAEIGLQDIPPTMEEVSRFKQQNDDVIANETSDDAASLQGHGDPGHGDPGHGDPVVASSEERLAKETAAKAIDPRTEKTAKNHELRLTTVEVPAAPKPSEKTEDKKEPPASITTPREQTTEKATAADDASDDTTTAIGGTTGVLIPSRPGAATAASGASRAGRTDLKQGGDGGGGGGGGEGATPPGGNDELAGKRNSGRFVDARSRIKNTSSTTSLEDALPLRPLASDVTFNRMTSPTTEILRSAKNKKKNKKMTSKEITPSTTAILDNNNNNNENNNDNDDDDNDNNNALTSVGAEIKQALEIDAAPPGGENRTAGTTNIELQTTALGKSRRAFRRPAFCSLHHVRGNCHDVTGRWYFDPVSESCLPFNYSGCGGNANRYATLARCQVTCAGKATTTTTTTELGSGTRTDFPAGRRQQQVVLSRPMRYASPGLLSSASSPSVNPQRLALQFFLDGIKRDLVRTPEDFLLSNSPIALPFKENPLDPIGRRVDPSVGRRTVDEDERKPEEAATMQHFEAKELRTEELGSRTTEEVEDEDGNRRKKENGRSHVNKGREPREMERLLGSVPDFRKINSEHVTTEAGKLPIRNRFEESARMPEFRGIEDIRKYPRIDPVDEEDILRTHHHHHQRPGRPTEFFSPRPTDKELARRAEEQRRWSSGQLPVPRPNPKQQQQRLQLDTRPVLPFGGPRELRNIGWIEQTIILPGLPQIGLPLLPRFLDRDPDQNRLRGGHPMLSRRGPGNWIIQAGAMDLLPSSTAVLLRKKSFLIEAHHPEMEPHKDGGISPYHPTRTTGPGGVRAAPRQETPKRLPLPSPASSPDRRALPSEAALGRFRSSGVLAPDVDPERRPLVEESGSEPRDFGRFRKRNDPPRSERYQAREPSFPIPGGRPYGFPARRRPPFDRFTFFQIFVNRDRHPPHPPPPPPPPPPPGRPPVPDHVVPSRRQEFDPEETGNGAERRHFRYQSAPALPWRPFSGTPGDRMRDSEDRINDSMYDKMLSKSADPTLHSDDLELPRNSPISPSMEKACRLPLDTQSCRIYRPKWYFDQEKGTCAFFHFGGCTGTGNGFETIEDCLKACKATSELEHEDDEPEVKVEVDEPEVKVEDVDTGSENGNEDVVVFTSPVYGEEAEEEESKNKGQIKVTSDVTDHVVRPVTKVVPTPSGEVVESRSTNGHVVRDSLEKATTVTVTAVVGGTEERETGDEADLAKSFSVQYIAIVTTLGVVGLAIVIMIIVSIARLCKRARRSKREHCIQEVIKTHLYGDLPQGLYSESPTTSSSVASSSPSSRVTEKEEKPEHK